MYQLKKHRKIQYIYQRGNSQIEKADVHIIIVHQLFPILLRRLYNLLFFSKS